MRLKCYAVAVINKYTSGEDVGDDDDDEDGRWDQFLMLKIMLPLLSM